jgi:hypothetical protein
MPLTAYLNNTRLDENLVTNATGHVTFTRNLNPGQDRVAYTVQVAFEGTGNQTATLNATDFMGSPYQVCQTVQFTYRPSANTTIIVVEPQATDVTGPSKTPEELQQEAEDEGWLQIWHEFSWMPPGYRLHAKLAINDLTMHLAFNPLLPLWPGIVELSGLETMLTPLPSSPQPPSPPPPSADETSQILRGVVVKAFLGALLLGATAVAVSFTPLPAAILAMAIYGFGSAALIWHAAATYYSSEWGAHTKAHAKLASLLLAFVGAAVAVEMSFSAGTIFKTVVISVLSAFLANLVNPSSLEISLNSLCLSIWTGLFLALAILKIPNPGISNVYFRPAFLITNLALIAITMATMLGLPL